MHRRLCLTALAALFACNTTRTPASATTQHTSHTTSVAESASDAATAAEIGPTLSIGASSWTGRCADIVSRLRAVKSRLPSACQQDGDCQCYVGGVSDVTGCGGASDAATAAEIARIQAEFRAARCDYGVNCSPRVCDVRCVNQRCVER